MTDFSLLNKLKLHNGVNNRADIMVLTASPLPGGVAAEIGTLGLYNDQLSGNLWRKFGAANTDWVEVAQSTTMVTQTAHGLVVGTPVFNLAGVWTAADSSDSSKLGIALVLPVTVNQLLVAFSGPVTLTTAQWDAQTGDSGGLTAGEYYYVADGGGLASTEPTSPAYSNPIMLALSTTTAVILPLRPSAPAAAVATATALVQLSSGLTAGPVSNLTVSGLDLDADLSYSIEFFVEKVPSAKYNLSLRFNGASAAKYGNYYHGWSGGTFYAQEGPTTSGVLGQMNTTEGPLWCRLEVRKDPNVGIVMWAAEFTARPQSLLTIDHKGSVGESYGSWIHDGANVTTIDIFDSGGTNYSNFKYTIYTPRTIHLA